MKSQEYKLKEVCLEITDACPLNCKHCSGECGSNGQSMLSLYQIERVINDLAVLGVETLEISGGEPLLHPALSQIIEYAAKKQLEIILYTSGNIIGTQKQTVSVSSDLASKLQKSGLNKVIFGLQGATSSTHEALTQVRGSFDNALHSIKVMREFGFWIGVHFVPMKINYNEFAAVCELSRLLEVNEIGVLRFVPQGRGRENMQDLNLPKTEFAEFSNVLRKLVDKWGSQRIRVGRPIDFRFIIDPYETKTECDAGKSRCLISPDGTVKPCPAFKNCADKFVAGNVKERSLVNIWNDSSRWVDLRQFDYEMIGEPCGCCNLLEKCKGGCIAQRILKCDDLYVGSDPCCFKVTMPIATNSLSRTKTREQAKQQLQPIQI